MSDPNATWPRPADEPRSQPFQPVSYDFEPEYTPPQAMQPPVQPPAYQPPVEPPVHPPAYQPPVQQPPFQPAYQPPPPLYQQPVYAGVPPQAPYQPPAKRSRRGLKITLSVIGGVLALCAIGSCVAAYPVIKDYGSTVTAPDELPGGLTKSTDAAMQSTVDDLKKELNSDLSTDSAVAGYYEKSTNDHQVLFAAVATVVVFPGTQIDDAFKGLDNSLPVTEIQSYPAGTYGGTLKCGASTSSGLKLALCVWADYGTVGIGALFARTPAEAAPLFLQIREATESR